VINSNLSSTLHRFRDIAFHMGQNRYIWLPLLRLTPFLLPDGGGFPWDDLRKIFTERSEMVKVQNGIETFPKILIA